MNNLVGSKFLYFFVRQTGYVCYLCVFWLEQDVPTIRVGIEKILSAPRWFLQATAIDCDTEVVFLYVCSYVCHTNTLASAKFFYFRSFYSYKEF